MDSPLSRSPGSSVFSGVGLPITLPSSVLGGPQRLLEYWGTPPHSSSLLPLPLRQGVFQWAASLRTSPWVLPEAPSRGWLLPLLDCQLDVGGRAWPWARNRFTSSSLANSAKMVVFPSTHLHREQGQVSVLLETKATPWGKVSLGPVPSYGCALPIPNQILPLPGLLAATHWCAQHVCELMSDTTNLGPLSISAICILG